MSVSGSFQSHCTLHHHTSQYLHNHQILIDLGGDGAEEGGELVLTRGYLSVSVCQYTYIGSHYVRNAVCYTVSYTCSAALSSKSRNGTHLVLSGMPILKHCSWISAMHFRGAEVAEGGAMSVVNKNSQWAGKCQFGREEN